MRPLLLRPLRAGDWESVSRIFWDTFVLGDPVPFRLGLREAYSNLALGWFRANPESSRVVDVGGRIAGYVLVCTDHASFSSAQRRAALDYLSIAVPALFGRTTRLERKFVLYRLIDGFEAWRDEDPMAVGAHAHFNLARGYRSGLAVKRFVEHIDAVCSEAGFTHWTGQMNARDGQRIGLLRRYGFTVHSRTRNRTLSWLARAEVDRLTVVRQIGAIQRLPVAS